MRPGHLLPLLALFACGGRPDPDLPETIEVGAALPTAETWTPPADWASIPPYEFAALMERALPEEALTPLPPEVYEELREALIPMDARSVRAAVMLARSRTPQAGDILARRLSHRKVGPERNSDAADVIAAAALARFPDPEQYWRILRLVDGEAPHPDLEVRVECACTALFIGFDRAIPFLLQVLRLETWAGQRDELDFTPPEKTAWARDRAAIALSRRAGVPRRYFADAPIADREREAARLEELLADIAANASLVDPRLLDRF